MRKETFYALFCKETNCSLQSLLQHHKKTTVSKVDEVHCVHMRELRDTFGALTRPPPVTAKPAFVGLEKHELAQASQRSQ